MTGGTPGNLNSSTHGAYSETRIRPIARNRKRRFLARAGLRASELSAVTLARLNGWARLEAKVELIDRHVNEHGLIRADGELEGVMRAYVSLENSARLALTKLEEALRAERGKREESLGEYLERAYGEGDGDG